MKWSIPAKTFLVGEYAALAKRGAILLTTTPYFELTLSDKIGLHGIHPDSPAGRWWLQSGFIDKGLHWYDPYQCGGLGASSAQFIGTYKATSFLNRIKTNQTDMLNAYWQCAWQGQGLQPSGYDVIAQSLSGCVSIHRQEERLETWGWPFPDLSFIIAHTGNKLATHHHLQETIQIGDVNELDEIVARGHAAFKKADSEALIETVNDYYQALLGMSLVDKRTQQFILNLQDCKEILAIKGCGAMGTDVLLCMTKISHAEIVSHRLQLMGLNILATQASLLQFSLLA